MKRKHETIEEAITIYTDTCGAIPTITEIESLYHEYRKNWKQFKGFRDWLIYMGF